MPARYQNVKPSSDRPNDYGMFISGIEGSGKTYGATRVLAGMLPEAISDQNGLVVNYTFSAAWVSAPKLLSDLRGTFRKDGGPSEQDILNQYIGLKLLVLDDLGAEKATDFTSQAIYMLLSERINWMRPTIVTSNLSIEEIHRSDPRLASRLNGMVQKEADDKDLRAEGK